MEALPWYDSRRLREGLWELEEAMEGDEGSAPPGWAPDEIDPEIGGGRRRSRPAWRPDEGDDRLEATGSPDVWRVRPDADLSRPPVRRAAQGEHNMTPGDLDEFAALGMTTRRREGAR